ncbi:MAG: hypothetical protein C0408_02270 [Odoribacter sp.]|nr:hypothetical protein [Odoribacter sp.]
MPFLELFDETLDINATENYELSVELCPESLSFCVLDTIRNKFILLRSLQPEDNRNYTSEELGDIIFKDDFLTKRYKKVSIIMPSPKFTLIPSPLFDPGRKDEYFSFNHVTAGSDLILNNKLTDPDSFLVYTASQNLHDLIKTRWQGVHPFHQLKPLLEYCSGAARNTNENYVHVHVERDFFNLIYYSHNTLRFCNSFNYRNISDILYYILNVFKSMDIKQEETVHLSGQTERYDDLFSNLALYVRNIKFAVPSGNFTFSYVFNETGLHRFINLFSAVNCV